LLVACVSADTGEGITTTPGWIKLISHEDTVPHWIGIWYKLPAVGGDPPPVFTDGAGIRPMVAQLMEFSGVLGPGLSIDGFNVGNSATLTLPGTDSAAGFLIIWAGGWDVGPDGPATFTESFNNATAVHTGDVKSAAQDFSSFAYGITGTAQPTWYTDEASIVTYGRREASFASSTTTTQAALDALGAAYIKAHSSPLRHSALLLPPGSPAGLTAGQTINVTNSLYGLAAQPFRIQSVDTTYPADDKPQFAVQFADPIVTVTTQMVGLQSQMAAGTAASTTPTSTLGTLGYSQVTATQGPFTVLTDLTGLTVTVTVGSGRRIRIIGFAPMQSTVAGDSVDLFIRESGTTLQTATFALNVIGGNFAASVSMVLTPAAGSHTYNLSAQRIAGTGNITMSAAATAPAHIVVEDIGT
jgi:hypothetical protein